MTFRFFDRHGSPSRRILTIVIGTIGITAAWVVAGAQTPEGWRAGAQFQREMIPQNRASFRFCRLVYDRVRTEDGGRGWETDYPMADRNLTIRLSDFTTTEVNRYDDGEPAHALLRATDPELFECPFLFASDVGTAGFSGEERDALRAYLLKGGFLWADDFWGNVAMSHWLREMASIVPEYQHVRIDPGHPALDSYYTLESIPQIPNIQFWRRTGGQTSERGAESAEATMSALVDERGRIAVLMTHNTDLADGWEREAEDYDFFARFSPPAYAVGINVIVYTMTH